jgi:hypothetical protein
MIRNPTAAGYTGQEYHNAIRWAAVIRKRFIGAGERSGVGSLFNVTASEETWTHVSISAISHKL